jgi:hypothetical protein
VGLAVDGGGGTWLLYCGTKSVLCIKLSLVWGIVINLHIVKYHIQDSQKNTSGFAYNF